MEHNSECHVTYLFTIRHGPYNSGVRVIHIVRRYYRGQPNDLRVKPFARGNLSRDPPVDPEVSDGCSATTGSRALVRVAPQHVSFHSPMTQSEKCPTALNGGTCTDSTCSKSHDYKLCKPCSLTLHISTWKAHTSGKKHLKKVVPIGPPNASTPLQAPSPQVTPSNLQSIRPANASPLSGGSNRSTPTVGTSALTSGSQGGGSRTKVAYCATTLQGDTCTDSRCQYLHDVVRCGPCDGSYPASLFYQHLSGRLHLDNVASNGSTGSSTSQHPLSSQHTPPDPQPTPLQTTSPPSQAISGPSTLTPDPLGRVIVSHEDGLDFIVEGTGTATRPCFPVVDHNISIEKTAEASGLSVESMTLTSSTGQWCE